MMNLYKKLREATEITDEMEKHFVDRTRKHIDLVQKAVQKTISVYPSLFPELAQRAELHDKSKFEEPERTPYVQLTWDKKNEIKSNADDVKRATLHHITTNAHHPEFHLKDKGQANISAEDRDKSDKVIDASNMPDIDIAEMIADWQAMSEELKTNTAREWYNKMKDVRWHFSEKQDKLIDKLLKVFETEEKK